MKLVDFESARAIRIRLLPNLLKLLLGIGDTIGFIISGISAIILINYIGKAYITTLGELIKSRKFHKFSASEVFEEFPTRVNKMK
jgi:hypothetical protein